MADIKKFSGFVTEDGVTHASLKLAKAHTLAVKLKTAVESSFGFVDPITHGEALQRDESDNLVIFAEDVSKFLLDNRLAILAAFNQEVVMRAPGGGRRKKAAEATVTGAPETAP